jgi:hypothetical protein
MVSDPCLHDPQLRGFRKTTVYDSFLGIEYSDLVGNRLHILMNSRIASRYPPLPHTHTHNTILHLLLGYEDRYKRVFYKSTDAAPLPDYQLRSLVTFK